MTISVTNSKSPITVVDDKVTIKVASGVGPQGAVGPQGPVGPAGAGYTLPAATTTALGGIVVGDNLTVDANGRLSGQQGGVTLLNGQTGVITIASAGGVTASGGTITIGYVAPPVSSVAGRTGAVTLTTADISGYTSPPVTSVAGRTGAVTIAAADVSGLPAAAAAAAPVQSVAGRTGAVTLTTADVSGYVAPAVSSVAGRTGAVTLTTADVSGYVAPAVTSVAGRTGAVTIAAADVTGLGSLATQSGTFSGTSSGTNTGDQTAATVSVAGGYSSFTPSPLTVEGALGAISGALENKADSSPATTVSLGPIIVGAGLGVESGIVAVSYGSTAATACQGNDARLSDARTPTAHAASHATGGSDALAYSDIGAQKTITVSSAAPTGGSNGDLYVQTSASGQVTPATLTADANDYAPGAGDIYRISSDAARNITGWAAWGDGTVKLLVNVGVHPITLKHQSASSSSGNRFITPTAGDYIIPPSGSAIIYWDATDSRVRAL